MRGIRSFAVVGACLMAALVGGACSSDSKSSSSGDKTAFCKTNADISARLNTATSEADLVQGFKDVQSKFDSFVKDAPSEVKADAQKLVDAAKKSIQDNNASQFQTDTSLQSAGEHVDTFCGQRASSSTSASTSASTSSSDSESESTSSSSSSSTTGSSGSSTSDSESSSSSSS